MLEGVKLFGTVQGVIHRDRRGLIIRTAYGTYSVLGEDLDRYLGDQVEISGPVHASPERAPSIQVDRVRAI